MYSSLKTTAAVSIVISLFNTAGAILTLMFLVSMEEISYTALLAIGAFLFSTSILFLLLSFFLYSLYSDLTAHEDSNYDDLSSLRKRVEILEKTPKN